MYGLPVYQPGRGYGGRRFEKSEAFLPPGIFGGKRQCEGKTTVKENEDDCRENEKYGGKQFGYPRDV